MSRELASHLVKMAATAKPGLSLQRGTVATWDDVNGFVIYVNGSNLTGVLLLESTGSLTPGDQVAVLRQGGSALILGTITDPA